MEACPDNPCSLFLSAVAWAGFVAVTLWTIAFLAGVVVPRAVDGPPRTTTAVAVAVDLALLLAVRRAALGDGASPRSRRGCAAGSRRRSSARRTSSPPTSASSCCWCCGNPGAARSGTSTAPAAVVLWSLCAAGWLLAITATFAVDHLELTGLRQAGWAAPRDSARTNELQVGGLHAIVRHPLMTGLLLAFWATPHMGASHLLFALASTAYIAIGIRFEERDLRRSFGASYDAYAAHVPAPAAQTPHQTRPGLISDPLTAEHTERNSQRLTLEPHPWPRCTWAQQLRLPLMGIVFRARTGGPVRGRSPDRRRNDEA